MGRKERNYFRGSQRAESHPGLEKTNYFRGSKRAILIPGVENTGNTTVGHKGGITPADYKERNYSRGSK